MQARESGLLGILCALVAAIALAAPATADATARFASPTGMNSGPCGTIPGACTLQRAVEDVAVFGDEVIVLPGNYPEGADPLEVNESIYVHGQLGSAVPSVTFTNPAGQAVLVSNAPQVERLAITVTGSTPAALRIQGGVIQQLSVIQQGAGDTACAVEWYVTFRDSVCWASAANGIGLTALADSLPVNPTFRNLTIEGTGSPSRGLVANAINGGSLSLDVKNTIVRGTAPSPDVEASALDATSNVAVVLERSNYATESEVPMGGTQFVTNPGTNSNQTAPPVLVNRAGGNFHQLPGSPTVDAGASFTAIGALDLDGDSRTLESTASCIPGIARPDIGADELVPAFLDCVSPETGITKGPRGKTGRRRASFEFSSNEVAAFQCSLDERPFAPCASPQVYRKLRTGKHDFNVRAVDSGGNLDASPAERVWRVKPKKRKRRPGK